MYGVLGTRQAGHAASRLADAHGHAGSQEGQNTFMLKDLTPGTKYSYRVCVVHENEIGWDYTSGTFTTPGKAE